MLKGVKLQTNKYSDQFVSSFDFLDSNLKQNRSHVILIATNIDNS